MSSLDRRAAFTAAQRTERPPYPEHVDHADVRGRDASEAPRSGWTPPPARHALAGRHKLLVTRPFAQHERHHLSGQFVNLIRLPSTFAREGGQIPAPPPRRSQPRNRPSMDEGLCRE